jgi:hypothetical protein
MRVLYKIKLFFGALYILLKYLLYYSDMVNEKCWLNEMLIALKKDEFLTHAI